MEVSMKKFLTVSILLVLALFTSCENKNVGGTASLTVNVNDSRARDFEPTKGSDMITKVEVTLTSLFTLNGQKVTQTIACVDEKAVFKDLPIGKYTLSGKSFNNLNVEISNGSKTIELVPNANTISLQLDKMVGEGIADVAYYYEPLNYPEASTTLKVEMVNKDGKVVGGLENCTIEKHNGYFLYNQTLPAGSYLLKVQLYSHNVLADGMITAVKIFNGSTYKAQFFLSGNIGNSQGSINVSNSASNMMKCVVDKTAVTGTNKYNLVCTTTLLPKGYTEANLVYAWYKNGELMPTSTTKTIEVTKTPAKIQYCCVVKTDKNGSWGSAKEYV